MIDCDNLRPSTVINIDISLVDLVSDPTLVFSSHEGHTELSFAEEVDLISITVKVLRLRDGNQWAKITVMVRYSHLQTCISAVIMLSCNYSSTISLMTFKDGIPESSEKPFPHEYIAHSERRKINCLIHGEIFLKVHD